MKARTIHEDKLQAGAPLTRVFHDHLLEIKRSDAKNPEVQNRFEEALAQNPRRPGPDVSFSGNEAKPLFHYTGNGYTEIGTTMGISRTEDGRGFVLIDLDGDGTLDLVQHNYFRNPIVALLNRSGGDGAWIRVRLVGTKSNRFGIGARVTVNGRVQELSCGGGYLSGNAPELHFGLGAASKADVSIRWPSGKTEEYKQLDVRRIHTFTEGDASARRSEELKRETIEMPAESTAAAEPDVRTLLKNLQTLKGEPASVDGPAIAILFSTTCHACIADLRRMSELEQQARSLGVKLAWIALDRDPMKVEQDFQKNGAPVQPFLPLRPLIGMPTPTVYLVAGDAVEKFTGRHAVTAAFEAAAARK